MDRVWQFAAQMGLLAIIVVSAGLLTRYLFARWNPYKPDSGEWIKQNWAKAVLLYILTVIIWAPCLEELLFRAPLLVGYPSLTPHAWQAIKISSVLFGLAHFFNVKCFLSLVTGDNSPIAFLPEKKEWRSKAILAICAFAAGIFLGRYVIEYQSLWVVVAMHSVWNLLLPIAVQVIGAIVYLIVVIAWLLFISVRSLLGYE